jgi:monovalent cation:H+ antiporter-2, CPA2 family
VRGVPAVSGDAAEPAVLIQAHVARARTLVIAVPDTLKIRQMLETARMLNPGIDTVVHAQSEEEAGILENAGAGKVFLGARELALGITRHVLGRMKPSSPD